MKKMILPALVLSLALLAGCSDDKPATPGTTAKSNTEATTTAAPAATTKAAAPETTTAVPTTAAPVTEVPTEVPTAETETQAVTSEAPTEPTDERVDPWSLMGEASFDQGTYTDENGNSYTYSYDIPCLKADTPDAKAINADIDAFFGGMVQEAKQSIEKRLSLSLDSVGFYGEVWNDVLSLVVMGHWDWDFTDYRVYCYDVSTGCWLDTAGVLEKMGISQADFLDTCKTRFRQHFEENFGSIPEDQRENYGYYEALKTVDGPEYVNMDLMVYPNANGDLQVVAPIVSLAGAAYYYHVINLGVNELN